MNKLLKDQDQKLGRRVVSKNVFYQLNTLLAIVINWFYGYINIGVRLIKAKQKF